MKKLALGATSALAIPLFLAACGGGSSSSVTATAQPQAVIAAQTASCSYAHVWLTVASASVLRDDSGTEVAQDVTFIAPKRIDLMNSQGLLQAMGATPLLAGHYTQLRLVLAADGNSVQDTDGTTTALDVPSGTTTGLKLGGDITVQAGSAADVATAGFDPCAAIVPTAGGAYALQPRSQMLIQPIPAAPPEVAGMPGSVIPAPGGGYAVADSHGTIWTLQRFDAAGNAVGGPVSVTIGAPYFGSFAALADGGWAAVWFEPTSTTGVQQVYTQAWDAQGQARSAPTPVALTDPGRLSGPAEVPNIAALAGGGYVVIWGLPPTDDGVWAQRFTAAGAPAAEPVQVVETSNGSIGVAALAAGGYVVTWGRLGISDTGGVQAFSSTDVRLASIQSAGSNGAGGGPPIPVDRGLAGGGAVTVWQAVREHVMMQQLAADGTPIGPAQVVDDQTASPVFANIGVGALPDGGSVIAWAEGGNMYARRYLPGGAPAGQQTKINLVSTGYAGAPVGVGVRDDGSFEIHWRAFNSDGTTTSYVRTFPAGSLAG